MDKRRTYKSLRYALLAGASAVLSWTSPALSANIPETSLHYFALSGGALGDALRSFSDQSGLSLVYDHRIVAGKNAPAVSGALTTRDALEALLQGSSLDYLEIDSTTLAIIRRPIVIELMPELSSIGYDFRPIDHARVDEIIVTSSYRAPGAAPGARINYALDAETLELSGAQNIAEPIHDLPANVASVTASNTQLRGSAGGLNLTDLRGLGPIRSLVLINNRRLVRTSGGNGVVYGVDLNAIPTALIDRVEIINQGAGAALGTDAVAGAVNIVMRDHIDGIAFSAHVGLSERGDAAEYSVSGFAGTEFAGGRGRVSGGLVYGMDPSLFYTDRDYLAQPYGFAANGLRTTPLAGDFTPGFGGSITTPAGRIAGAIDQNGNAAIISGIANQPLLTPDGFENFTGRVDQLYNWLTGFSALPEIDRLHGYGRVDYDAASNVSLFGEVLFSDINTLSQIAPTPVSADRGIDPLVGDSIIVPADHPDAPAGLRQAIETRVGGPIESFVISRRFAELGPRRYDIDRQIVDFTIGADIELGDGWLLNASYKYGRSKVHSLETGVPDAERVAIAVNPDLCAASPGCIPFNIFSAESASDEVADYYRLATRTRQISTIEQIARVSGSGPLYEIGEREGRISAGIEYRRDMLNDGGYVTSTNNPGLGVFQTITSSGSVGYGEFFIGADLPVLSSSSSIGAVEFGGDVRLTRWDNGGFVANLSGQVSWTPVRGVELYAYALRGGRAPNVIELHSAGIRTSKSLTDPCAAPIATPFSANCAAAGPLGAPPGFTQQNQLVPIVATANPYLDNESVRTRHFGIAADLQEFIDLGDDKLRLTMDWRRHRILNGIERVNSQFAINSCYQSEDFDYFYCGTNPATGSLYIQRDASTRQLTLLEYGYANISDARISGLDATFAYRRDLYWGAFAPTFAFDIIYSYTHKAEFSGFLSQSLVDQTGSVDFPQHQIYATASLEAERWKTLWTLRRRGAAFTRRNSVAEASLPARVNVDVGLQFRPDDNIIIYGGIENLFDEDLPIAPFAEHGYLAAQYDPIGRRYFAGVKAEF